MDDLVKQTASKPKRVTTDAGTVEHYSIDELIKAEQWQAAKKRKGFGIKIGRLVPGGMND